MVMSLKTSTGGHEKLAGWTYEWTPATLVRSKAAVAALMYPASQEVAIVALGNGEIVAQCSYR